MCKKCNSTEKKLCARIVEWIIMICFLGLWMFWPNTVIRHLCVTLNTGQNRIVYYIPGKIVSVSMDSDYVTYNYNQEEYSGGTVLSIEVKKEDETINNNVISFKYQYRGPAVKRQKALDMEMAPVKWAQDYSACIYQDVNQGYYFSSRQEGTKQIGYYYVEEYAYDGLKRLCIYISIGMAALLFLGEPTIKSQNLWKKKHHKDYPELNQLLENYLRKYVSEDIPSEYCHWIKRVVLRRQSMIYNAYRSLIFLTVTGGLVFHSSIGGLLLYELINFFLWTIACAIYICVEGNLVKRNIERIYKKEPLLAMWCRYNVKNFSGDKSRWSLLDLDFAVYMMKNRTYNESLCFADRIWSLFGKKKRGAQFLEYHYLKFCNFHYLGGNENEEKKHLFLLKRELKRPKRIFYKKYYTQIKQELDKI